MTTREVTPPSYSRSCDFCETAVVAGYQLPSNWAVVSYGVGLHAAGAGDMCPECRKKFRAAFPFFFELRAKNTPPEHQE